MCIDIGGFILVNQHHLGWPCIDFALHRHPFIVSWIFVGTDLQGTLLMPSKSIKKFSPSSLCSTLGAANSCRVFKEHTNHTKRSTDIVPPLLIQRVTDCGQTSNVSEHGKIVKETRNRVLNQRQQMATKMMQSVPSSP